MSCPNEALAKLKTATEVHALTGKDVQGRSKDFGAAIRDSRRRRGITRAKFAKLVGYTPTMISYLESGERIWSLEKAAAAIKVVNRAGLWPVRGSK